MYQALSFFCNNGRGLDTRLLDSHNNNHCFDIIHRRTEQFSVAEHFNGNGHTLADMTVMTINLIHSHNSCLCKTWEISWINTWGPNILRELTSGLIVCETFLFTLSLHRGSNVHVHLWHQGYWILSYREWIIIERMTTISIMCLLSIMYGASTDLEEGIEYTKTSTKRCAQDIVWSFSINYV